MIFCGSTRRAWERAEVADPANPRHRPRVGPPRQQRRTARQQQRRPNPSSSSARIDVPGFGFFALTSTPCERRSVVSSLLFQNEGTWVENSVVAVALESLGGYLTLVLNVPWIVSALDEIDFTFPASS